MNPLHFIQSLFIGPKNARPTRTANLNLKKRPINQVIGPNPAICGSAVSRDVKRATRVLQLNNAFEQNILNANPVIAQPNNLRQGVLTNGAKAAGTYSNLQRPHEIVLANTAIGRSPKVIAHEGLHKLWNDNPASHADFIKAYNSSVNPDIKNYLSARLRNYSTAQGVNFADFNSINPHTQSEIHSYLSEYPGLGGYAGGSLNNYYSKYFNPATMQRIRKLSMPMRRK